MTNRVIRIGVAGLGKMGILHTAIYNTLPGSRITAAAEPSRLKREALSTFNSSIRVFAEPQKMLESGEIDALVIATPVAMHVPLAIASTQHGTPFFVEKPLAVTTVQAEELVTALQKNPILHMVGYMTRFVDSFEKGREIITSGCLGQLQRVTGTIYVSQLFRRGRGWRYDRKVSGGGCLHTQGSHLLDLLTWYFGPVTRVNAEALSVYSAEVEDFAHLMLEFRSGLRAWVDSSWSVRFRRTVETTIEVLGENGSLTVTDDKVQLFLDEAAGGWPPGQRVLTAVNLYRGVPLDIAGPQYTREALSFLAALKTGTSPQPDVQQALHVQRIVDAAYISSLKDGAPVWIQE
jgi:predicted dehydrogenase